MSVHVMSDVFRHSDAKLGARLMLLVLADSASEDGVSWLLQDTIAERAGLSTRQLKRVQRDLIDAGELEVRQAQRGRRRVNVYRVLVGRRPEVDYDRLPFELDDPFTEGHPVTPSESDEVTFPSSTGGHPVIETPSDTSLTKEPPVEPSLSARGPRTVARKATTGFERATAREILGIWNELAGQDLRAETWLAKIILRLREYPEATVENHRLIIWTALQNPWWKGVASPSVVYGSDAQFERSVQAVRVTSPVNGPEARVARLQRLIDKRKRAA